MLPRGPQPPMVTIVGGKNHGKTTLLVKLAAELHRRGHRVMTIKHGTHTFNIDPATTDTYRHYHEGHAERVAMAASDKFALVARWSEELPPEEIAARYMADADIVLGEGFKGSALPKIEIFRLAVAPDGQPLIRRSPPPAGEYLAVVSDDPRITTEVPVIDLNAPDWLAPLADLVEERVMHRERAR